MTAGRLARACLLLIFSLPAAAAGEPEPSPHEIHDGWRARLDGRHFTARVRMTVQLDSQEEERLLQIWRDDVDERERLYARFDSPYDLRNLAILYIENSDRENDYFMYQPSTKRIRRISHGVARQDIYGVDLEYLGFGLAQSEPTEIETLELTHLDDRPTLRVVERARSWNPRFETRVSWIDPTNLVLMRTEHHRHGERRLIGRTEQIRMIQGLPVPTRIVFERPSAQEVVTMEVDEIDFQSPIPPDVFSVLQLMK